MQNRRGKVAVVTGAASGIGRAMVERFAAAGMKVVLADVEADALDVAATEVGSSGAEVLAVPTDVSDGDQVDAVVANRFYILTHPESTPAVQARMERIVAGRNPEWNRPA